MPIARINTPLVPPPNNVDSRVRGETAELQSPIVLVSPLGDLELEHGEVSIGRSPSSDLCFDDPLISRHHARIVILVDGGVVVDDLGSTNGVFVNGVRVCGRSERLSAGDRLLVGTTEVGLFSASRSGKLRIRAQPGRESKPVARVGALRSLQVSAAAAPPVARAAKEVARAPQEVTPQATKLRSDAFDIVSQLAERLLEGGRKEEAMRLLGENLRAVALNATVEHKLPQKVVERASEQAFKLFAWSGAQEWIEYVIELHLRAQRLLSADHFEALSAAMRSLGGHVDPKLIDQYIESLCSQWSSMSSQERQLFTRLAMLGVPG